MNTRKTKRIFLRTMMKLVFIRSIFFTHQKQFLVTEVFKSANKLNPQFMWCFFENLQIPYNLRCGSLVKLPGTSITTYGINSLNFRGAILWNIIPKNIKLSETLPEFKRRLKKQLIPCNCAAYRFQYYRIYTYPNNCLVSSQIVIGVKLGFIIFTWIGLVITL